MAPEQADRADNVNHRSDVYSLGATLFRLICGRAPYAASSNQSPLEKLRLLANERPPGVATLRPELPRELSALIDRTLDRDPANRPASAAHLAESLKPFCDAADLSSLVARAKSLSISGDESMSASMNSAAPSLAGLVWAPESKPIGKIRTQSSGRFRVVARVLIGLAMFSAAIAAGIFLILETQKGQVVIETDSPNINVELIAESAARQEIELVPGENVTRIYAGRYEVRINDGTDKYVIDQNAFVMKRGERVVARITVDESAKKADIAWSENSKAYHKEPKQEPGYRAPQKWTTQAELESRSLVVYPVTGDIELYQRVVSSLLADDKEMRMEADPEGARLIVHATGRTHRELEALLAEMDSPSASRGSMFNGPVYEGKSLDEWLNILEFETSQELLENSLEAIKQITNRNSDALELVRTIATNNIRKGNGDPWVIALISTLGLFEYQIEILENRLFEQGGDLKKQILEALEGSATLAIDWEKFGETERFLQTLKRTANSPAFVDDPEFRTLLLEIVRNVIRHMSNPPRKIESSTTAVESLYSDWLRFALDCPIMGPRVLVEELAVNGLVSEKSRAILFEAALSILENSKTDEPRFRMAMVVVDKLTEDSERLSDDLRYRALESIDRRLKSLAARDGEQTRQCQMIVSNAFWVGGRNWYQDHGDESWPLFLDYYSGNAYSDQLGEMSIGRNDWAWRFRSERPGNIVLELLELYGAVKKRCGEINKDVPMEGIQKIATETAGNYDKLQTLREENLKGGELRDKYWTWDDQSVTFVAKFLPKNVSEAEIRVGGMSGGDASRGGGAGLDDGGEPTGYDSFSIPLEPPVAMGAMIRIVAQKILNRQ